MENPNLSDAARARAYLAGAGFRFSRALGQNFLLDDGWNARIAALSGAGEGDRVLEVGPGAGTLTCALLRTGAEVRAVEIDKSLAEVLRKMLEPFPLARVIYADILKTDIPALMGEGPYRVVSNLPYAVAAELLPRLVSLDRPPESVTAMVQREAAERMLSRPGEKNWCALAARMRYFCDMEWVDTLPPSAFTPNAHVESALIRCRVYPGPDSRPARPRDEALFLRVINAAFAMRRKTFANNIAAAFPINKAAAARLLANVGVSPEARGETLSLEELASVADAIGTEAAR